MGTTGNMLVSKEISNNGTSWPETVLGSFQKLLIVDSLELVLNHLLIQKNVSCYMNYVTTKDLTLESVMILHLLILTMKLNQLKYQKERPSISITYHVSMDRMLNSLHQLIA